MITLTHILKLIVTAGAFSVWISTAALAESDRLDQLFGDLAVAEGRESRRLADEIWFEWSQSGSAAMDLLLKRGRDALDAGNIPAAIEHFTALIDHAPEFPEGWNARATAYFLAGLYGPSIADIEQVLALEPRHFGALSGLAVILEELGYPQDALDMWQKVQAIHPGQDGLESAIARLKAGLDGTSL
ncbi:tetratricopeptide repeat protein [Candidatus Halocynthiibacter alkanivorans]|jgi:tetratricopeptide (TPR) repeat protein|uniref:tetratricopeptide repeat protein n=1 Tax=Candidatus Halocynthiibacter alkanivorans TaxID=2267619 RepID=UPI000DF40A99|nr:tetratricopeptide repeat protein [Candidatus Halocynthiibacter alkanivorans]